MLLSVIALQSCAPKDQPEEKPPSNGLKTYGIEHAILHFEHGGMSRGTETLWIDSFGHAEARDISSEQITDQGFRPHKTLSIRSGASVTIVDSMRKEAFRFTEPLIDSLANLPASMVPAPDEQFKRYFTQLGYSHIGDTTVIGLPCHIWKQNGVPNYLLEWRGVIVGRHMESQAGAIDLMLRSIDTTTPIDRSRFVIPSGIPVQPRPPQP